MKPTLLLLLGVTLLSSCAVDGVMQTKNGPAPFSASALTKSKNKETYFKSKEYVYYNKREEHDETVVPQYVRDAYTVKVITKGMVDVTKHTIANPNKIPKDPNIIPKDPNVIPVDPNVIPVNPNIVQ